MEFIEFLRARENTEEVWISRLWTTFKYLQDSGISMAGQMHILVDIVSRMASSYKTIRCHNLKHCKGIWVSRKLEVGIELSALKFEIVFTCGAYGCAEVRILFFFLWWRVSQQKLRMHRSLKGLLCNPVMKKRNMISFFFLSNGATVAWNWRGNTEVLGEKPVPVTHCPPQNSHKQTRDRTRASAVRSRRLTAWAMARPLVSYISVKRFCISSMPKVWRNVWQVRGGSWPF
jgi:hypothetical protein